jgi:outer membrane protein assembly factor BamB
MGLFDGTTGGAAEPSAVPVRNLAETVPERFDVHVDDLTGENVPVVQPWKTIRLDPAYRGGWVVVGDLTGDGVAEVVSARCGALGPDTHYTSSVVAHRLDGSVLWWWGNPEARNTIWHDVACQIHDLKGDGRNEVVVAADRRVVVLDGATGKELREFEIPAGASDCLTFCNLSGADRAADMLVKTRYTQIWAYDVSGKLLWTIEKPGGYRTAHQPFPIDLEGDGRDEVIAGFAALNHDGSLRWRLPNTGVAGGHADAIRLFQDGDRPEEKRLLVTHCGGNRMDMLDGNGRYVWSVTGLHFESVFFGQLDKRLPGREIVVDICHTPWGQQPLLVLDENGKLLGRYTTMRSRQHRLIDWFGDGEDLVFLGQARALLDGRGNMRVRFQTPMPEGAFGPDNAPAARQNPQSELRYMVHLADVTGDGRPDLVVNTVPGTAVWIYRNERGAKNLCPSRLTMPLNATLY